MSRLLLPDLLRSLAIALMVAFHLAYDLEFYYGIELDTHAGVWLWIGKLAAVLFLGLAGVSTALSHARGFSWRRSLIRAGRILLGAAIITVATYLFDPSSYVRFGILHLIGVTVLLLSLLRFFGRRSLLVTIPLLSLLFLVTPPSLLVSLPSWLGIPLGTPPLSFVSVDYYPLFPWAGVMIAGYGLGMIAMPWLVRTKTVQESHVVLRWMSVPGRYSLWIYLIHQPIILGMLWIMHL